VDDSYVETDRPERNAGTADPLPDLETRRMAADGELGARLKALALSHPSSLRYQAERSPSGTDTRSDASVPAEAEDEAGRPTGGWEAIVEQFGDRPLPADIRVSAERRRHILEGDQTGGGHRSGVGSPGKTEFPAAWDDERVMANVLSVAREPDERPMRQNWNDRWRVQGNREGVGIVAIVASDGLVWTAWPREGSPGVVKNKP
jgi:hypothetical protein